MYICKIVFSVNKLKLTMTVDWAAGAGGWLGVDKKLGVPKELDSVGFSLITLGFGKIGAALGFTDCVRSRGAFVWFLKIENFSFFPLWRHNDISYFFNILVFISGSFAIEFIPQRYIFNIKYTDLMTSYLGKKSSEKKNTELPVSPFSARYQFKNQIEAI